MKKIYAYNALQPLKITIPDEITERCIEIRKMIGRMDLFKDENVVMTKRMPIKYTKSSWNKWHTEHGIYLEINEKCIDLKMTNFDSADTLIDYKSLEKLPSLYLNKRFLYVLRGDKQFLDWEKDQKLALSIIDKEDVSKVRSMLVTEEL